LHADLLANVLGDLFLPSNSARRRAISSADICATFW
jgi:hypothetical protein